MILNPWVLVYEGESGTGAGEGNPPATPPASDKKFTQDDVNKFLADDRRKHEKRVQDTVAQLEEVKKAKGLSDQERETLQTQIDDMKNSLLTKEEQAKREKEKLQNQHKMDLENVAKDRDNWKNNFAIETITNSILTASATHKAISSEQVQAILFPNTRIAEVLDSDGKPTGRFMPKVKFSDKDKEGKPIELDLTVEEAVKRMKELPERFGNLFESDTAGGLGGMGAGRGGRVIDPTVRPTDPQKFREWRQKQKTLGRK